MKIEIRQDEQVRGELRSDYEKIAEVNNKAFGRECEANLIKNLRKRTEYRAELSLVACVGEKIVGHILFFPVAIESASQNYPTLSLGPLAVLPEYQNKGFGKKLVKAGLESARKLGYKSAIVLGHPSYYPKFGFKPASQFKIKSSIEAPDEAFMAIELQENALSGISGIVRYPKEFDEASSE